jgi:integrase
MATIKIVLRKKKNKDNTFPLALRITKDRKTSFIHLGQHVKDSDWNEATQRVKKTHPNSVRLNNFLLTKLAEANDKSLELETAKPVVTARAVSQKIKPKAGDTVFSQADLYISRLKEDGKYNRWNSEKSNVQHLKNFLKNDIAFQDLTIPLLERFKSYLKTKERKVSERTAINNLITVRSVFSQAIKEGVCDSKYYPFGKGKIKIKFPDSKKMGLNAEEVASIEKAELDADGNHARNIWLLSFYFAGVRISDVLRLKWSDFQDGRLYYAMGKNTKGDSLKISEKVEAILRQYKDKKREDSDLIFPELLGVDLEDMFETQRIISSRINSIDRVLRKKVAPAAKVTKPLTMHISRHTFGNISGDKIPIQMLQKLYRHTDIKTTIGYQANFIHSDVDEALEAVIGRQ